MKTEIKLLGCPFCGQPPCTTPSGMVGCQTRYLGEPSDCPAFGKFSPIALWSTRAPQSPWIKVEDRLPDLEERILVRSLNDEPEIARRCEQRFCMLATVAKGAGYCGPGFVSEVAGDLPIEDVTHWMPIPPLPQPPIEKGGV